MLKNKRSSRMGGQTCFMERLKSPDLQAFVDGTDDEKDDLDSYLLHFERYATVANWSSESRATQLSTYSCKALDVYSNLIARTLWI